MTTTDTPRRELTDHLVAIGADRDRLDSLTLEQFTRCCEIAHQRATEQNELAAQEAERAVLAANTANETAETATLAADVAHELADNAEQALRRAHSIIVSAFHDE
jgi:hypothetical protein